MSRVLDDEAKTALLDRAWQAGINERAEFADSAGTAPPSDFLAMYYRHVPLDDLTYLPALDVYGGAMSHWQLGQVRTPGVALVRAVSPTLDESGWASPHTVIEIITDDMPYLVDSVSAELNRVDREIHLVVHPIFAVHRNDEGRLSEVDGCLGDEVNETPVAELADGVILESWIHVEIDRETDPADLSAIEERLQAVLADVRRSCEDEPEMRERALRVADELDATATAVPAVAGEVGDVVALLRWLVEDNFTFVGYRMRDTRPEAERNPAPGPDLLPLGILGSEEFRPGYAPLDRLPVEIRERSREKLLIITKASFRSTVHRNVYLDFVGVKRYDDSGQVIGEHVFLGLFTSAAYTDRVRRVPVVRRKVAEVVRRSGFPASSHSSRDLMHILETFPREELFQAPVEHIERVALGVLFLQERRRVRLFARSDDYERFVSVLVYLPRDRFNTAVRYRIQDILGEVYAAETIDYRVSLSDSVLARLQFVLRMRQGTGVPEIDTLELETRVASATRSWMDEFEDALVLQVGEEEAATLLREQPDPMPEAYKEDFDPKTGVTDLLRVLDLGTESGLGMSLYSPHGAPEGERRFKVFRDSPLSLAEVLPVLQRMGVEVTDERPYELRLGLGRTAYLYDFGLRYAPSGEDPSADSKQRFHDTFAAVWRDLAESDGFNALVLRAGLTWRQAALLRAYGKYLRQVGTPFSQEYLEAALVSHTSIARLLVELFETRFDPAGVELRDMQAAALAAEIATGLNSVASLDQDRILRSYLHLIRATLRTNYYQVDEAGDPKPYISFKLDPQSIPDLPAPRPLFEIWVYSPRMEGVHLRFGPVARGGLRWSDRREDFRTEVLGLVKAQTVKNAVIVPAGAKGGFVVKRPPTPAADGTVDRDAVLAEGIACYQQFIRALLDVTDNLVMRDGQLELAPPPAVVRHDEDDPYLVVAADKGTASFSDYANAVSADYGFWLGDAFASGGSAGYDHKVMGITARGAWESVRRHFRERGRDTQTEDFTVVGVGDMSGDVFGNGMLLSEHIRLVAAFDHRHIFLDPDPAAAVSYAERRRMFELPRSSWADYRADLISPGGGVFERTRKSIPLSPEVKDRLGINPAVEQLSPVELMRAILTAPVDLLWNGGIGTYVKASTETHLAVGDKANDALRVDGRDLRCLAVGEGGNLGFTQLGRVEYSTWGCEGTGGRINTDAIDNSAGVDTSDHEVNLKILLNAAVADGELTQPHRNELLMEVQDEVARLVLRHNYEQNVLLGVACAQSAPMLAVHRRLINALEAAGELDRELEYLPSEIVLEEREAVGGALTSPELSVLLAYSKTWLGKEIMASSLPEEDWYTQVLRGYFPDKVADRFEPRLQGHRLRRDIIVTEVVNDIVHRGGMTFVFRAMEETGAAVPEVARAFTVIREVFGFDRFWAQIEALDGQIPTSAQITLYLDGRRLLDRAVRWLLNSRSSSIDVRAEIDGFRPHFEAMAPRVSELLVGYEQQRLRRRAGEFEEMGFPAELALHGAGLLDTFSLLDVIEIAQAAGKPVEVVGRLYFTLSDRFAVDILLTRIADLPRGNRWHNLARSALRYDLYSALAALAADVLATTPTATPEEQILVWEQNNAEGLARAERTLREVLAGESPDLAVLSVALRSIRTLLRTG